MNMLSSDDNFDVVKWSVPNESNQISDEPSISGSEDGDPEIPDDVQLSVVSKEISKGI